MTKPAKLQPRIKPAPVREMNTVTPGSWRTSNQSAAERGYDHKWRKARRLFLMANPLCVICQAQGRVTPANTVDHIIPHRGDKIAFWDESNWQALCAPCHNRKTQEEMAQGL